MRFRSWRTATSAESTGEKIHTGDAREQLAGKELDVRIREWRETIALQKVEHALAVEVGDDADVVPEVEAVAQMDAPVAVATVGNTGL